MENSGSQYQDTDTLKDEHPLKKRLIAFFLALVFLGGVVFTAWPGFYLPSLDFIFDSAELAQDSRIEEWQQTVVQLNVLARPDQLTPASRPVAQQRGTGFNIDPNGVIITNYHVVEDAVRIVVTFPGGGVYNVQNLAGQPEWDLAVLILDNRSGPLPAAPMGNSDQARPQDEIIVIGNPLGLENIVIKGTLGRTLRLQDRTAPVMELIAPVHPGHSGSPVIDHTGQVIGVVFGTLKTDGETRGLALPVNYVREYLATLGP